MNVRQNTLEEMLFENLPDDEEKVYVEDKVAIYGDLEDKKQPEKDVNDYIVFPIRARFLVIVICKKGCVKMRINMQDVELRENHSVIVVPGAVYENIDVSKDAVVSVIALNSTMFTIFHRGNKIFPIDFTRPIEVEGTPAEIALVGEILALMKKTLRNKVLKEEDVVIEGFFGVLHGIFEQMLERKSESEKKWKRSRAHEIYATFVKDVAENFIEHREVSFYAERQWISVKHFGQMIKEVSGLHPGEIIRNFVIMEAKILLREGQMNIQQVADKLNFANQSFFGKYFKQSTGMSPRDFMKWNR